MTNSTATLPPRLTVAGLDFEVHRSGARQSIGITVDRDGLLIVNAPLGSDETDLAVFAHEKRMWVYKKLAEKDLLLSHRPTKEFVSGEGFTYLGRSHRLLLLNERGTSIKLRRGRILMQRDLVRRGQGSRAMIDWYRTCALRWLPQRVEPWVQRMGVRPSGIGVRDLGYRWGSLSKDGQMNFHWATIQLTPRLIDYVIVHELAHICEPNHMPEFWLRVERAMPEFQSIKAKLAVVGGGLWLGDTPNGRESGL